MLQRMRCQSGGQAKSMKSLLMTLAKEPGSKQGAAGMGVLEVAHLKELVQAHAAGTLGGPSASYKVPKDDLESWTHTQFKSFQAFNSTGERDGTLHDQSVPKSS